MNYLALPSATFLPEIRVHSCWLENYAFGYDLIHCMKPRRLVELGVFHGGSYFVFHQAIRDVGCETEGYAVDTWEGDSQAGTLNEEHFLTFKKTHDTFCGSRSKILRMTFDEALRLFEDESVDLLHIDGFHTYEAVKKDYETWAPKVAPGGVILFHDVRVVDEEKKFGVKKFWTELRQGKLSFEMENDFGLGVLYNGSEVPDGNEYLRRLFSGTETDRFEINLYYQLIKERLVLREVIPAYQNCQKLIQKQDERIKELEAKIKAKIWSQS